MRTIHPSASEHPAVFSPWIGPVCMGLKMPALWLFTKNKHDRNTFKSADYAKLLDGVQNKKADSTRKMNPPGYVP
jgi:hypothetical protein